MNPLKQKIYHIFLASPNDMSDYRQAVRQYFREFNISTAKRWHIRFEVVDWENYATYGVGEPQKLITQQTLERFKGSLSLVIGVLGQRSGLPTSDHESGTEEEFEWALKANQENDFPEIKWFFQDIQTLKLPADLEQATLALDQWKKVCAFKKRLSNGSPPLFYNTFLDLESFKAVLGKDLSIWLNDPDRHWHKKDNGAEKKKSKGSISRKKQSKPLSQPSLSPAVAAYQQRLREETAKLRLIGLGNNIHLNLPIKEAYVPLEILIPHSLMELDVGKFGMLHAKLEKVVYTFVKKYSFHLN